MHEYVNIGGQQELITSSEDLLVILRRVNYDVAEELDKDLHKALSEEQLQKRKEQSDMLAYESQLDENRGAFADILETLKSLDDIIGSKRINKDNAAKCIRDLRNIISDVY